MSIFSAVQVFWLPVLVAPLCLAGAIAGVRLFRSRATPAPLRSDQRGVRRTTLRSADEFDVAAEVKTVLDRLAAQATRQFVTFLTGIEPGLTARGDAAVFRRVVGSLLETAVRRAPCGTVLLTGGRVGSRVQFSITDDSSVGALVMAETVLCEIAQMVGQQGGTLDIVARPGEGSVATIRLPAGQVTSGQAQPEDAMRKVASPV